MKRALAPEVKLREVWAWSMYDFANSAYTTVVITAVFSAFFVAGVADKASWATFAWTAALSVSYAAILVRRCSSVSNLVAADLFLALAQAFVIGEPESAIFDNRPADCRAKLIALAHRFWRA